MNYSWIQSLGVIFMFFLNSFQKMHTQPPQINLDLFAPYFQSKFRTADIGRIYECQFFIWK